LFNRYLSEDREAFEDLYRPVENNAELEGDTPVSDEEKKEIPIHNETKRENAEKKESVAVSKGVLGSKLDIKRILKGIGIGDGGILPLLLLLFLVLDVEDDEKLLIFALAIVLGI